MEKAVAQAIQKSHHIKDAPSYVEFVAWNESKAPDKYVYSLESGLTWGPNYRHARKFESAEDARKQLVAAGVDAEMFLFGSIGEGAKRTRIFKSF